MIKVATQVDAPITLLWPKSVWLASDRGFTILGLGDVVVPGIFVALALRYDVYQGQNGKGPRRVFFWASLTGYCLGLITTMAVMHTFRAAQPALLYIR
jgi:minor histocompatibility antigen H13